jgi:hypothetical protein
MDTNIKLGSGSSISNPKIKVKDIPNPPTITSVVDNGVGGVVVNFTPSNIGGIADSYTVTSSPGSITSTSSSSPIWMTNLNYGTAYTFTVTANNSTGVSSASTASSSVTPTFIGSYDSIQTVAVGAGGVSVISFTSIPAGYTNLQIRAIGRTGRSAGGTVADDVYIRFNSDQTSVYTNQYIYSNGSNIYAIGEANISYLYAQLAGNALTQYAQGIMLMDIYDYSNTTKFKTMTAQCGASQNTATMQSMMSGGMWRSTSAINRIDIIPGTANFQQYSHFALYGIR